MFCFVLFFPYFCTTWPLESNPLIIVWLMKISRHISQLVYYPNHSSLGCTEIGESLDWVRSIVHTNQDIFRTHSEGGANIINLGTYHLETLLDGPRLLWQLLWTFLEHTGHTVTSLTKSFSRTFQHPWQCAITHGLNSVSSSYTPSVLYLLEVARTHTPARAPASWFLIARRFQGLMSQDKENK